MLHTLAEMRQELAFRNVHGHRTEKRSQQYNIKEMLFVSCPTSLFVYFLFLFVFQDRVCCGLIFPSSEFLVLFL